MANVNKYLDAAGVGVLWTLVKEYVNDKTEGIVTNQALDKIQQDINTLKGDVNTEGSIAKQVATEIATIVNDNNNGSIDTLNEIAAWIINDQTGAASMNAAITANTNKFSGMTEDTVVNHVSNAIAQIDTTEALSQAEIEEAIAAVNKTNLE